MDFQTAIVRDEPQRAKLVHKEADAGAGGTDDGNQGLLNDRRYNCFRLHLLPEVRQQEKCPRQTLLA
jgi:hypothetical protein